MDSEPQQYITLNNELESQGAVKHLNFSLARFKGGVSSHTPTKWYLKIRKKFQKHPNQFDRWFQLENTGSSEIALKMLKDQGSMSSNHYFLAMSQNYFLCVKRDQH